jgi:phosphoribosylformylglycinamidine synthase
MGAAGLTSSSVEMASKGGVGIRLDMSRVPCREEGMTPYEMMLSESQERMLMVLKPGREGEAEAIFKKWELDFAVIGTVTDTGRMELVWNGETVADIPLGPLADEAPQYERTYAVPKAPEPLADIPECTDIAADLLKLMASPNLASRRWVWEQYDQSVGANTVQRPGGDAAVVRVHGSKKALAITTDCTPRYCYADPYEGGKQAVAEAYRNLCAVGAKPLAITNCLNFGNPQRPEIMGQFVGCIEGMAEACRALDLPVVSGNVSLYNETKNEDGSSLAILPTPAIGGVGLLEDWEKSATIGFKAEGETICILGCGRRDSGGHVGQSIWLREIHGGKEGPPPPVDLGREKAVGTLVRQLIAQGMVTAVHDVSDGGTAVAIAEMALAGGVGAEVLLCTPFAADAFAEDQGLYIVTVKKDELVDALNALENACEEAGIECVDIGVVGGVTLKFLDVKEWKAGRFNGLAEIPLADLRAAHEGFFPKLMGNELTPEF